jgi:ABC-type transport system involved in multi-copper enzyme maturation permease subunit
MYLVENPVLQRELLVNLRMKRAFFLLFIYQALLASVVYFAWPQDTRVDPTRHESARQLIDLFFVGQYMLASLMAPSFAAGTITGEKERKTYEMLLASPLRPAAIVLGKLLASLTHLAALIFASLADRDVVPAVGRRVAVGSIGRLPGADRLRRDIRHGECGV